MPRTTWSSGMSNDPEIGLDAAEIADTLDPARHIGRAPQQVDAFLRAEVDPLLRDSMRKNDVPESEGMSTAAISNTRLPFPLVRRGKVRDVYDVGDDRLLIVATDRISAFDVVMPQPIPRKGDVLTQITAWWLRTARRRAAATT